MFTRISNTSPSQNWKTTRSQFGLKCLQTKLLIMWQVGTGNLMALVKTFSWLFKDQLIHVRNQHKSKQKLPSVHVLGDFNFKVIDWTDRLNKSGVSQSKGKMLIDIMNDHGLEQLVHFPTQEKHIGFNTHFSPWSVSGYPLPGQT